MAVHKSQIKIISLILCIAMIINFLCSISVNAYIDVVDTEPITDIKEYENNKDKNQYKISDNKGLTIFSDLVNSGIKFSGKTIYLSNDIEFDIGVANNFTPIGSYDTIAFEGTFDGQGHVISGININNTNESYKAIFSYTTSSTTIKNLGVIDSIINGKTTVAAISAINIGGTIENCYNNSTLECRNILGGIVGHNTGKIINCINYSSIASNSILLGGICGKNSGEISICCNLGKLISGNSTNDIGGICAENSSDINNCYNTGYISGNNKSNTGGICGSTYVDLTPSNISNTYNVGSVTGGKYAGGIIGINRYFGSGTSLINNYYLITTANNGIGRDDSGNAEVYSETSDKMKTDEFRDILNTSASTQENTHIWKRNDNLNYGYPNFKSDDNPIYRLEIINDSDNGVISYNGKIGDEVYVEEGTRIELEVIPNSDYLLSRLIINDVSINNTTGEFIMPSKDSTVSPIFSEASADDNNNSSNDEVSDSENNDISDSNTESNVDPVPDVIEDFNEDTKLEDSNTNNDKENSVIKKFYNNIFNTGDNKNIIYLISVMLVSFAVIILMIILRKNKKI